MESNFEKEKDIWLIYPKKASGKPRILYNDAVEEALCFGWIDSTVKRFDDNHTMQRFCARRPKSGYSQANKERMKWLLKEGMLHPSQVEMGEKIAMEEFIFPEDILAEIKANSEAWIRFQALSDSYKRIRIAYIEMGRKRPEDFQRRLDYFIDKTSQGKIIKGYGGIEKYY